MIANFVGARKRHPVGLGGRRRHLILRMPPPVRCRPCAHAGTVRHRRAGATVADLRVHALAGRRRRRTTEFCAGAASSGHARRTRTSWAIRKIRVGVRAAGVGQRQRRRGLRLDFRPVRNCRNARMARWRATAAPIGAGSVHRLPASMPPLWRRCSSMLMAWLPLLSPTAGCDAPQRRTAPAVATGPTPIAARTRTGQRRTIYRYGRAPALYAPPPRPSSPDCAHAIPTPAALAGAAQARPSPHARPERADVAFALRTPRTTTPTICVSASPTHPAEKRL